MTIASIAYAVPKTRLSNADLLQELSNRDRAPANPASRKVLDGIGETLERCGSAERHIELAPRQGYALALIEEAVAKALAEAELKPGEIDLLVYCGVARGWLEPSTASVVQAAIGAGNASCFDVLEACAGWMRAVQIAQALLQAGSYQNALIVGAEAGMQPYGPQTEALADFKSENYVAFTVGEAATATVLRRGELDRLAVEIHSLGEHFDLSMIPLANAEYFLPAENSGGHDGGRFFSQADKLFSIAISHGVRLWQQKIAEIGLENIDLAVVHGASTRASDIVRRALDIPTEKWRCSHARFGNTEVNTIPIAIASAAEAGQLKRGQRVFCLVAGSGISIGWGSLIY